jgi:predicted enzyme related to lactoylglutathione lyase
MSNSNVLVWFEIYVEDMARAKNFYEAVLAKKMEDMEVPDGHDIEMASFPYVEGGFGASGALVKDKTRQPNVNGTLVYLGCEDCSIELSRVEAAGGKLVAPKFPIGQYGFCGIAIDTEGNSIGFHSMK